MVAARPGRSKAGVVSGQRVLRGAAAALGAGVFVCSSGGAADNDKVHFSAWVVSPFIFTSDKIKTC